jgi:hypothetical protein
VAKPLVRGSFLEGQNEPVFGQISRISIQGSCLIVDATVMVSLETRVPGFPRFEDRAIRLLTNIGFKFLVVDPIWPSSVLSAWSFLLVPWRDGKAVIFAPMTTVASDSKSTAHSA